PAISRGVPTGPRGVDEQRGESLHPAIDRDVIHLDAPFRQQLLHVAIGQPVPQIPSHRHHDHIRWEAETSEAGPRYWRSGRMTTHRPSLPGLVIRRRNSAPSGSVKLMV